MRQKTITLALQGGGSHGAFTWGVLDRLLEDERVEIEGVSGASAGAMNAVVLAQGLAAGGRDGARQALHDFWDAVALKAPFPLLSDESYVPAAAVPQPGVVSPVDAYLALARFFSPYQLNPFDINPLRDILASQIDFERVKADSRLRLFIAATQVSTGKLKLFRNRQLSIDVLLASACLPAMHRAVEIDGEAYWDGGFTANPPIFPLLHRCRASDIVVVLLDSHPRPDTPATVGQIRERLTEINFSSALYTEMQAIALAKREARRGLFSLGRVERRLRNLNMHVIESREFMSKLSSGSKLNTYAPFIKALRDEGRRKAEAWMEENFHHLGSRSSISLAKFTR
jgi:NTE family protein